MLSMPIRSVSTSAHALTNASVQYTLQIVGMAKWILL